MRLLLSLLLLLAACGSATDPSDEGIDLIAKGEVFEQGGPITVELVNGLDQPVGFNFCQRFWERRVGARWERVEELAICTPAFETLPPGESVERTLGVPYGLTPGVWRVSAAINVGDEPESVISNEFVIEAGLQR
jgi:hypothetical protein